MGARGDLIIIATYANFDEAEIAVHKPLVVLVDSGNKKSEKKAPAGLAVVG
jgi:aspartate 1-decarboxylase